MNRRMMILRAVLLVCCLTAALPAAAQTLPTVHIGFLNDRPAAGWADGFRDSLRAEIIRILEVDYNVDAPAELTLTADGSRESVRQALQQLQADTRVDMIVATGPLGTLAASRMEALAHPVVGCWILDPALQGIPFEEGVSGKANFTYVTTGSLTQNDLEVFNRVVDYDHLVAVGTEAWMAALPGDGSALEAYTNGRTSVLASDGTVSGTLAALPKDADAVYLMPMIGMDEAQISELLEGFIERKLPVMSMTGEKEVRAGAMVGVAPLSFIQRIYRRAALNVSQILSGFPAADLPVMMTLDSGVFINVATANRIGISPPFEIIIESVMIGEPMKAGDAHLDLQATMQEAQVRNNEIAAAERQVAAGAHQVGVSRGNLLPQADVGVSGELVDEDLARAIPFLSEETVAGTASFSQTIYSDRKWAGYSIEKHLQEARVGKLNRVRLDVGLEAAAAYLNVLAAQTRLTVQRQNLAFSRINRERAQVRVAVGDANRSELYRWESKIAGEKTRVMQAVTNLRLANYELNRVINRPMEDTIALFDNTLDDHYRSLLDPRLEAYTRDPAGLETLRDFLVQHGLMGSPELQQIDALILASEREHSLSNRSFWAPDIEFAGGLNHIFSRGGEGGLEVRNTDDTTWRIGLYVSLPILEGGSRFSENKRTTEETFRLRRQRMAVAQRIEQDVRASVFLAASSKLSIGLANQAAEAARLNLDIVADNYTLGQVSLVDLLDAQTNALNAELDAVDAVNNYLLDLMNVERAVGRFTFFATTAEREDFFDSLDRYATPRP